MGRIVTTVLFATVAGVIWLGFAAVVVWSCNRLLSAGISDDQRDVFALVVGMIAVIVAAVMYWREP